MQTSIKLTYIREQTSLNILERFFIFLSQHITLHIKQQVTSASNKLTSLAIHSDEKLALCGTLDGKVLLIDVETFDVIHEKSIHVGSIEATQFHQSLLLATAMSMDQSVSILDCSDPCNLEIITRYNFRYELDDEKEATMQPFYSLSQALSFHPKKPIIATRSGSSAVLELQLVDGKLTRNFCKRFHGTNDLTTVRYCNEGNLLLSAGSGDIVLSDNGEVIRSWDLPDYNVHWFEPITENEFLIAFDSRRLAKFNYTTTDPVMLGPVFMRDDFEHVNYNQVNNRIFAAGFDGAIYEMDIHSLSPIRVVWEAPYKLRWIKSLHTQPNILIAYCFNGGLYKIDVDYGTVLMVYRKMSPTIWSAVKSNECIFYAGESPQLHKVQLSDLQSNNCSFTPEIESYNKNTLSATYTKRLFLNGDDLLIGERNGQVLRFPVDAGMTTHELTHLHQNLRDITVGVDNFIYVGTEQGNLIKVENESGRIVNELLLPSGNPIWSVAAHPYLPLIAVAQFRGGVFLVDAERMVVKELVNPSVGRPKRMKWLQGNLFYVDVWDLRRYDLDRSEDHSYIQDCVNTIEDFIWNIDYRYIVLVGYRQEVILCDLTTGSKLSVVPDHADFSKGIEWISPEEHRDSYPLDFATFGIDGQFHRYRIHNDRVLSINACAPGTWAKGC